MSVGESGAGSEGSEYEDEDEEFSNQQEQQQRNNNRNSNSRDGAAALGRERGRAYDSLSRKLAYRASEDNHGRLAAGNHSLGQRRMERGASKETNPFFFLNSFPQHASNHAGTAPSTASAENGTIRDANYYTSLLTGSCFKSQHHEPSADQSLKQILSDPVSGELMDDAFIFPCGHSFGSAGLQKIQETNLCQICQVPTRVSDGSVNLALRAAVQAFRHDRGFPRSSPAARTAKRRRDPDGEQGLDGGRTKGVQFPYVVSDRVLIKGNKRTPERFVGKQAIITTQCLNGWYLVRTIDNGESVRLQYRSLQKIEDEAGWHQEPVAPEFASVDLSAHSVDNS